VQQSAIEHAALIWTRPSNTIRARGMYDAAYEAGYMSAPDDASKSAPKLPLAQGEVIHVAQIWRRAFLPFPRADLSCGLCDGYAKSCVTIWHCDVDLDLSELPVKVSRH